MSCYDTIIVRCPRCNKEHYLQSKSGKCELACYELDSVPNTVLSDANRHGPTHCVCGCVFRVRTELVHTFHVKGELEIL